MTTALVHAIPETAQIWDPLRAIQDHEASRSRPMTGTIVAIAGEIATPLVGSSTPQG